ncbi:MAG: hypothetical protein ACO1Q7_02105 [Gemmatimonas sp.]
MRVIRNMVNRYVTTKVTGVVENCLQKLTLVVEAPGYKSVHTAGCFEVIDKSTSSATDGGHPVALMGRFLLDNSGGGVAPVILAVANEGGMQIKGSGTINNGTVLAAHMNLNEGTFNLYRAFASYISNNNGVMTMAVHVHIDPSVGIVNNPLVEFSMLNDRETAIMSHKGKMYGPMGYAQALAGGELVPPNHPGLQINRYNLPAGFSTPTPVALAPNVIYGTFQYVPHGTPLAQLWMDVATAAASSNSRIGVYRVANGIPTTLVVDSGNISTASTGIRAATVSQTVQGGTYCFCVMSNGAPTIRFFLDPSQPRDSLTTQEGLYVPYTYGAFPASFPSITWANFSGFSPLLGYRI